MALQMVRPTKHPRTGVYRVRMTVPEQLRATTKRLFGVSREFIHSLHTKDAQEAKRRAPAVIESFAARLKAAEAERSGRQAHLNDREVGTLCGRWLRGQQASLRHEVRRSADECDEAASYLDDIAAGLDGSPEYAGNPRKDAIEAMRERVDALLASEGLAVDEDTRARLSVRLLDVERRWLRDLEERARSGRWVAHVKPEDFPAGPVRETRSAPAKPVACTFDTILAGFALERGWRLNAQPVDRALYDRQRTLQRLAQFLGHRDAERVTKADAVRWKEETLGKGRTAATVRNDLSEMAAIWDWAIRNGKLKGAENPFRGILPPKAKKRAREARAFTDAEAATILIAAREQKGLLRWMPWVLCLTGARLNEIGQATKEDVGTREGVPVIRIHDEGEGRSLKNADSRRTVPLHPDLVAEGFLDYVAALPAGSSLWPDVPPDGIFGLRSVTAGKKVARWLHRELGILDPTISPNHSWRHWFIGACRAAQIPTEVRSALTGHSAKLDESAFYGPKMQTFLQVLADNMAEVKCPVDCNRGHGEQPDDLRPGSVHRRSSLPASIS